MPDPDEFWPRTIFRSYLLGGYHRRRVSFPFGMDWDWRRWTIGFEVERWFDYVGGENILVGLRFFCVRVYVERDLYFEEDDPTRG